MIKKNSNTVAYFLTKKSAMIIISFCSIYKNTPTIQTKTYTSTKTNSLTNIIIKRNNKSLPSNNNTEKSTIQMVLRYKSATHNLNITSSAAASNDSSNKKKP